MASFVVAALLVYGNALSEVDAFRGTNFSPRTSFSKFEVVSQSFGNACVARSPRSRCCNDPQRVRRLFAAAAADSLKLDTASIDAGDNEAANEDEVGPERFFRSQNASNGDVEEFFPTPLLTTVTRGKKRRAIQKIREKHYSKKPDSRFVRTMLFPMKLLIWKPLWKVMDVMTDRLDEDESADLDSGQISSTSSSNIAETIAVIATPQHVVAMTTPDTVSDAVAQKDIAFVEPSINPTSPVEIQKAMTTPDTVSDVVAQKDSAFVEPSINPTSQVEIQKAMTTPDTVSDVVAQKDSAFAEPSINPTSHVEIQKETVDTIRSEPAAATSEATEDTVENKDENVAATIDATPDTPKGDRWAVAAPGVDLSGKWELIVTPEFKRVYDRYLERLGQPRFVRSVALSGPVIGQTMEEIIQIDCGESLLVRGKNVRGTWDRTLLSSGATKHSQDFEPLISPIMTVDQERVEAEAWWEDQGTAHVSWMRGVTMYGGGSFYSRRYIEEKEQEDDETVYVCEGFFEFDNPKKEDNELVWRFRRQT